MGPYGPKGACQTSRTEATSHWAGTCQLRVTRLPEDTVGPVPPTAPRPSQQDEQVSVWPESCPWWRGDGGAVNQVPLGGWWEGEGAVLANAQVRVHCPPSLWHENRYLVEAGCSLKPKYYATWARPQQLVSQSARSEGRNLGRRTEAEGEPASPCSLHCLVSWRHLVVTVRRRVQLYWGDLGSGPPVGPHQHPQKECYLYLS